MERGEGGSWERAGTGRGRELGESWSWERAGVELAFEAYLIQFWLHSVDGDLQLIVALSNRRSKVVQIEHLG